MISPWQWLVWGYFCLLISDFIISILLEVYSTFNFLCQTLSKKTLLVFCNFQNVSTNFKRNTTARYNLVFNLKVTFSKTCLITSLFWLSSRFLIRIMLVSSMGTYLSHHSWLRNFYHSDIIIEISHSPYHHLNIISTRLFSQNGPWHLHNSSL